jgi:hypothetical protein
MPYEVTWVSIAIGVRLVGNNSFRLCPTSAIGESFFATTNHGADGAGPAAGAEKIGRGRVNTGNLFGGLAPSSQRHYSEHCCRMVNDDALLC